MNNEELMHYGVLGMKWGVRRAQKKGTTYTYRSHGQKKWDKKLQKATKKSNGKETSRLTKARQKAELYRERDKFRQDYASRTNLGKSISKQLLFGPFGSGAYSRFRASGDSRLAAGLKSNIISSSLGLPVTILLSRGAEKKTARTSAMSKRR